MVLWPYLLERKATIFLLNSWKHKIIVEFWILLREISDRVSFGSSLRKKQIHLVYSFFLFFVTVSHFQLYTSHIKIIRAYGFSPLVLPTGAFGIREVSFGNGSLLGQGYNSFESVFSRWLCLSYFFNCFLVLQVSECSSLFSLWTCSLINLQILEWCYYHDFLRLRN